MQIFDALDISSSGLSAQRRKLTAIASNLANVDTTRTDEGGPYKRRRVVMLEAPKMTKFSTMLDQAENRLRVTDLRHRPEGEPRPGEFFCRVWGVESGSARGGGEAAHGIRSEPSRCARGRYGALPGRQYDHRNGRYDCSIKSV